MVRLSRRTRIAIGANHRVKRTHDSPYICCFPPYKPRTARSENQTLRYNGRATNVDSPTRKTDEPVLKVYNTLTKAKVRCLLEGEGIGG